MNKFVTLFGAAILALASLPVNAGLIPYTDRTEWNKDSEKFGSFITESFPKPIVSGPSIIFDKGIVSVGQDINAIGAEAAYRGRVNSGISSNNIAWMFPKPVFGFFGEFQKALSLTATVGNKTFEDIASNEGWTGFGVLFEPTDLTSLDPFSQVIWSLDPSAGSVAFKIKNFSYVEGVSAVPVPPALWLFGTGLLGLIGFSRRSKAV